MKSIIQIWSRVITFDCTWALFVHGTCVIVPGGSEDPRQRARELLRNGAEKSVSSIITLTDLPGWIVTSPHSDVLTYVGPADVGASASDVIIGYYGFAARSADERELRIIHVETATRRENRSTRRPSQSQTS